MADQDTDTRRPVRVVAVDDQASFRELAAALVASTPGFELVGESPDGESALRLVPQIDADMVIVDVRMSGMDGVDLAGRLRSQDPTRVIVLASTDGLDELAPLGRACGASAVVSKQWFTPRLLRGLWVAHRRR
jgi:DNA-binding NarL/FixJ family response regulator